MGPATRHHRHSVDVGDGRDTIAIAIALAVTVVEPVEDRGSFENGKSCADDQAYSVVISARRASSLSHEDVITEFKALTGSRL